MDCEESLDYLSVIFDPNREGLRHLGEKIAVLLDWRSLVHLKRTSRQVQAFLERSGEVEQRALRSKVLRDWKEGQPLVRRQPCVPSPGEVTGVRVLEGDEVLVACSSSVHLMSTTKPRAAKTYANDAKNQERGEIRHFDLLQGCLVAGSTSGILSVWNLKTTALLSSRQLFGMITGLRCLSEESTIATIHSSKAYDCGVIGVRRMISPTELQV